MAAQSKRVTWADRKPAARRNPTAPRNSHMPSLANRTATDALLAPTEGPIHTRTVKGDPHNDRCIVTIEIEGNERLVRVDSGVKPTLIGEPEWNAIKRYSKAKLVPTTRRLVPYSSDEQGHTEQVPLLGQAQVCLRSKAGAVIHTTIYDVKGDAESLLGDADAERLGIIHINPEGATQALNVQRVRPEDNRTPTQIGVQDVPC